MSNVPGVKRTRDFTFVYDGEDGTLTILFTDHRLTNQTIILLPTAVDGMLELLSRHTQDVNRYAAQLLSA